MKNNKRSIALVVAGMMLGTLLTGPVASAAEQLTAQRSTQRFYVDGERVQMEAYTIGGSNYVKLRDIGRMVGFMGVRGEAAHGFPSALQIGLPALKHWTEKGLPLNSAAALTLLMLIVRVEDTNMIRRGGLEKARKYREDASRILMETTPENSLKKLEKLDTEYIRDSLSPGGCADLLAISLMLYFSTQIKSRAERM